MRILFDETLLGGARTYSKTAPTPIDTTGQSKALLHSTINTIRNLASLNENWDSAGSAQPNRSAVLRAISIVESLYDQVTGTNQFTNNVWQSPHVSASEEGEVVFEWWKGLRKLVLYVGPCHDSYLTVWGPNIETEMSDGTFSSSTPQFVSLWQWLSA